MSQTCRQRLAGILRQFHLLDLADACWSQQMYWQQRKGNRRFLREHPDVPCPPRNILYDILGSYDLAGFYQSGREHAREITRLINTHHGSPSLHILEWGCGPARVLQHISAPPGHQWALSGSDYNPRSIDWCREQFPTIAFLENRLGPPIPIADGTFDVVFCISVFTHLSAPMHSAWAAEILRLLKTGGLFIGTFHGKNYRVQLTSAEQRRFDAGELVIRDKIREGKKNFAAYHPDQSIRSLLATFDSCWQETSPVFQQDLWCARKS